MSKKTALKRFANQRRLTTRRSLQRPLMQTKFAELNTKLAKTLHSLTELEALRDKVSSLEKKSKDLKDSAEFANNEITDLKATVIHACSNLERLGN